VFIVEYLSEGTVLRKEAAEEEEEKKAFFNTSLPHFKFHIYPPRHQRKF
jgi:hypothetical protein